MAFNVTAEIILKNESYLIARFSKEESTMEEGGKEKRAIREGRRKPKEKGE